MVVIKDSSCLISRTNQLIYKKFLLVSSLTKRTDAPAANAASLVHYYIGKKHTILDF